MRVSYYATGGVRRELMKGSKVNFGSIEEYIASFPKDVQQIMEQLRADNQSRRS